MIKMINNSLYETSTPVYDFDTDNIYSGYIPDQNQQDNPRDLYMQQLILQDMERQFQQYIQLKLAEQKAQQYYNIQRGDTLGQIAAAHGMNVQDLARLNGINNINLIRAGQRLRFNDDLDNVYRNTVPTRRTHTVRRSSTSDDVISSNPKRVQQLVKQVRKLDDERTYNGKVLPNVVITYKRPVKKNVNNKVYHVPEYKPTSNTGNQKNAYGLLPALLLVGRNINKQSADRRYKMYIYDIKNGRIPKNTTFGNYLKGLY